MQMMMMMITSCPADYWTASSITTSWQKNFYEGYDSCICPSWSWAGEYLEPSVMVLNSFIGLQRQDLTYNKMLWTLLAWIANLAMMEHVAGAVSWRMSEVNCGVVDAARRVMWNIACSLSDSLQLQQKTAVVSRPGSVSVRGMSWTVSTGSLQGQRRQMLDWFQAAKPPPPPAGTQRGRHEAFISSRGVNSPTCWPSNRSARRRRRRRAAAQFRRTKERNTSAPNWSSPPSFCRVVAHLCKTGTSRERSRCRRAF